ncbi:MAG TPA: hypothetical protein VFC67_11005, partial [Prolixibacteraceae bacterium]|nr:hypothetical protein [Prolixibacteraceae bacterium]
GHIPDLSFSDKIEIIPLIMSLAQLRPKHVAHLRPKQNLIGQNKVAQHEPKWVAQLRPLYLLKLLL